MGYTERSVQKEINRNRNRNEEIKEWTGECQFHQKMTTHISSSREDTTKQSTCTNILKLRELLLTLLNVLRITKNGILKREQSDCLTL